jgi:hypothetical protein
VEILFLAFPSARKDRVRGEYLATRGMAEAKALGIDVALLTSCTVPPPNSCLLYRSLNQVARPKSHFEEVLLGEA